MMPKHEAPQSGLRMSINGRESTRPATEWQNEQKFTNFSCSLFYRLTKLIVGVSLGKLPTTVDKLSSVQIFIIGVALIS